MHRKRELTPVFLPEKSHGQRSPTVHGVTKSWTRLSDWACIYTADLLCIQEELTQYCTVTILQQKLIWKRRRGQIQPEEPILWPYWKRQSFLLEKHCPGTKKSKSTTQCWLHTCPLHSAFCCHCMMLPLPWTLPWAVQGASPHLLQIIPTSGLGNAFPSWSSHHTSQTRLLFVCSVTQSCPTLCNPMDCYTLGFPVLHHLPELAQTHVHWVGDAIQPSCPLSSPSPPVFNLPQHQGLFQGVSFLYQAAKVLELQLQHQSFQWIFRTDFL